MITEVKQADTNQAIKSLLSQAIAQHKEGQIEAAIDSYLKSLELDKLLPDWVYENTIILLSQVGRGNQGLNLKEQALKIHANSDKVYRAIGLAFKQQGDLENSINYSLAAVKNNQEQPNWLYSSLIEMLVATKQLQKAIAIGHLGRKFHEDCPWINHHLAEALTAQGNSAEAKYYYSKASEIPANEPNTQDRINLADEKQKQTRNHLSCNFLADAVTKHKQGQAEEAIALYVKTLEIDKNQPSWVYGNVITLLANASRFELATEIGLQAETIYSQADEIYRARALVFDYKNDLDHAINFYQKAFDLNPQQPDWCYLNFAKKLLQIESIKKTIELTKKGLEYYPDYYYLNHIQAQAFAKQERWDEAISTYLYVQEQDPDWLEVTEKLTEAIEQKNKFKKSDNDLSNDRELQKIPSFWLTSKATDNIKPKNN